MPFAPFQKGHKPVNRTRTAPAAPPMPMPMPMPTRSPTPPQNKVPPGPLPQTPPGGGKGPFGQYLDQMAKSPTKKRSRKAPPAGPPKAGY